MIRTVYGPRFLRHKIPYINIIGFASDGANVMMGAKNSVKSGLKAESCFSLLKCTCHSLALCAAAASENPSIEVDHMLRQTYSYFKVSCK